MCLDVSKKILLSDLAKFWWRICPQSVFKLDKYCTKLQRIVVLCLLIKVCVLCSQLDFLAISPLSFIRDLGPKGLWVQIVCVSSLAILVLIYCCLNVFLQLFFLFSHCFVFFSTVKVIFWNGPGVTASRGSTALVTIRSASAGLAVGLWWRIHSFCTCPGGFHHNTNTPTCVLLSVTSHSSLFFSVVSCYNMPFRAVNVWEQTSATCFCCFFLFFIFGSYF